MPRKRTVLALVLLVTAALAAATWYRIRDEREANGVILLSGTLEGRTAALAFQVSGRILHVTAGEGDKVAAGQVVAELDDADLRLAVDQAEGALRAARATLAALQAGSRPQEIRAAEAAVAEAAARLEFARAEVARLRGLVPRKLASREQLERAESETKMAAAVLQRSRENLALLRAGPRAEDIERARGEVAVREAALAAARRRLAYARLQSPWPGLVSVRLAEPGEVVTVGRPVLELVDLAHPWVRAYLNARDLPRVRLGQEVEVHAFGIDTPLRGRLSFVSPEAEFTPKTVETHALRVDRVHRVKVDVPNPDGVLKIGMPVDILIHPPEP